MAALNFCRAAFACDFDTTRALPALAFAALVRATSIFTAAVFAALASMGVA
ncbi:hypothetical protein FHR33_007910 [Nonomuraea dietziae]|uniref:Uncharacterized protein n=1 Tax=Nonomuraea dietziae TaxID=65515 RepID=A0A7W5VE80_9ACTN|nr:hypothetical protein [Nonomuraea dietziae]MBB3732050.1 hypothetical protein [Nonomuraea dietziae]